MGKLLMQISRGCLHRALETPASMAGRSTVFTHLLHSVLNHSTPHGVQASFEAYEKVAGKSVVFTFNLLI